MADVASSLNTTGFTTLFLGWLRSGMFWVIIILGTALAIFGFLKLRKSRRLKYPTYILLNVGHGKVSIKRTWSGWFKRRSVFFGLIDTGSESVIKTKEGLKILAGSSTDFHEIEGKIGLIVKQKDDDPKILVPVSKVHIKNEWLLGEIAPADYRDASVQIIDEATNELRTTWEKVVGYVVFGLAIILAVVGFIFASQTFNHAIDKASELVIKAGQIVADANVKLNTIPSKAP